MNQKSRLIRRLLCLLAVIVIIALVLARKMYGGIFSATIGGAVLFAAWEIFSFVGGNALWDFIKGIFVSDGEESSSAKSLAEVLDQQSIYRITRETWRKKDGVYVPARKYCSLDSDRVKAEQRIARFTAKSGDVIVLLSASGCGKRASVSGMLATKLYPIYVVHSPIGDPTDVRNRIENLVAFCHKTTTFTLIVTVKKTLERKQVYELLEAMQRLRDEMREGDVSLNVIILATCFRTVVDKKDIFFFTPLNGDEALVLAKALEDLPSNSIKGELSPLALYDAKCKGHTAEYILDYSQGNPANVARFVDACVHFSDGEGPLLMYEREWGKRIAYVKTGDVGARRLMLFVLNVLVSLRMTGRESLNLGLLLEVICKSEGACGQEYRIKEMVAAALELDADLPDDPFLLNAVDINQTFANLFIDSRGRSDFIKYEGTWQRGVKLILSDERLREFREGYCHALLRATLAVNLYDALPGGRTPTSAYALVTLLKSLQSDSEASNGKFIDDFVCGAKEQIGVEVLNFLSCKCGVAEPLELLGLMNADLLCHGQDDSVSIVERFADFLPYYIAQSPYPSDWCVSIEFVQMNFIRAANGGIRGANAVVSCGLLLKMLLEINQEHILVADPAVDCWIGMAEQTVSKSFEKVSKVFGTLLTGLGISIRGDTPAIDTFNGVANWKNLEAIALFIEDDTFASRTEFVFAFELAWRCILGGSPADVRIDSMCARLRDAIAKRGGLAAASVSMRMDKLMFWTSMNRALMLPSNPQPKDFVNLYEKAKHKMDEESDKFGFDGETRTTFLIRVVDWIHSNLTWHKDQESYEGVLRESLVSMGKTIEERFVEFSWQDKCLLLAVFAPYLHCVSTKLQNRFVKCFDDVLQKIPNKGETVYSISEAVFDAFTKSAQFVVVNDKAFAMSRWPEIQAKAIYSPLLDCLTDEYKIKWIERLFPIFGINDPANTVVRMMGYAFGRDVVARLGRLSHSDFIDGQLLLLFAVRNRAIAKINMLSCADDFLFCLLSTFVAVKSRLELGPKQFEQLCLQYAFVLEHYGFPLLEKLTANKDKFALKLGLSVYKVAQIIDESGCRNGRSLVEIADNSIWVKNLSARTNRFSTRTNRLVVKSRNALDSIIKKLRSLSPLETLHVISSMHTFTSVVEGVSEVEEGEIADAEYDELMIEYDKFMVELFEILQVCRLALSESALLNGGYMAYDRALVDLFVADDRFFKTHADKFPSVVDYIQNEMSKHGDSKFYTHALDALRKAKKRCGA